MKLEQLIPLLIALVGSSGIIGLVSTLVGRKDNKEDREIELIKVAYERNAYLEKRVEELEKANSELRLSSSKKDNEILSYSYREGHFKEHIKYLERQIKEKRP